MAIGIDRLHKFREASASNDSATFAVHLSWTALLFSVARIETVSVGAHREIIASH